MALNLGTLLVKLKADTANFKTQMQGSLKQIKGMQSELRGVSVASGAAAAAFAAVGFSALKASAGFESSITRVKAISQATGKQFIDLQNAAKKLGATTEFSAKQAADGMQFLAMAGISTTNTIKAMPKVLQLATAGAMDLATSADIVTNVMAGMKVPIDDLGHANDILVTTFTSSNVALNQLGEAFKFVGPIAQTAGISFEEISAAIGLLGNAGIQGSMAGTTLRGALAKLAKPSDEAVEAMTRLGISTHDSSGKMKPLLNILQQLEKAAPNTADFMTLFGLRAGPGMAALVNQGSGALQKLLDKMKESGGVAERIQKEQLQTLTGRLQILKSAFEGVQISIGEGLTPAAKGLVSGLTKVLEGFNKLPTPLKTMIAYAGALSGGFLAIVAGITGIMAILPSAIAGFAAFKTVIPVLLPVLAVLGKIALAVGLILLVVGVMKKAFTGAANVIENAFGGAFGALFKMIAKMFDMVTGLSKRVAGGLGAGLIRLKGLILGENKALVEENVKALKSTIDEITFTSAAADVGDAMAEGAGVFGNVFTKTFDRAFGKMQKSFQVDFSGDLNMKKEAEKSGIMDISAGDLGLAGGVDFAASKGSKPNEMDLQFNAEEIAEIGEALKTDGELMKDALGEAGNTIVGGLGDFGTVLNSTIEGFKKGPIAGVVNLITQLLIRTKAFKHISKVLNDVLKIAVNTLNPLVKALVPIIKVVGKLAAILMSAFGPMLARITTALEIVGFVLEKVAKIIQLIFTGIAKVWNGIIGAIGKIFSFLANLSIFGLRPFAFFDPLVGMFKKMKINTEGLNNSLSNMDTATQDVTTSLEGVAMAGNKLSNAQANASERLVQTLRGEIQNIFGKELITDFANVINPKDQFNNLFGAIGFSALKDLGLNSENMVAAVDNWIGAIDVNSEEQRNALKEFIAAPLSAEEFENVLLQLESDLLGQGVDTGIIDSLLSTLTEDFTAAQASGDVSAFSALKSLLPPEFFENFLAPFLEGTEEAAEALSGLEKTTEAVSESLSNIPQGFKIAAERFEAIEALSPEELAAQNGNQIQNMNVYGVEDPNAVVGMIQDASEVAGMAETGSASGPINTAQNPDATGIGG